MTSSAKARALRERMSIDPDAPEPVGDGRRHPRQAPVAEKDTAEPPAPAPAPAAAPEPAAEVAADSAPAPAPEAPHDQTPPSPGRGSGTTRSRRTNRRSPRSDVGWETALDDPAVATGGNGYRSFYVSDEVFARFRAAVYWTARRPDAENVPDNMSVGVEDYMESIATDLERRFNARAVFPPTPDQIRSHRKRENRR